MNEENIKTGKLAKAVGVTPACISRLRKGHPASRGVAKRISDTIGINVLYLLYPQDAERQESTAENAAEASN